MALAPAAAAAGRNPKGRAHFVPINGSSDEPLALDASPTRPMSRRRKRPRRDSRR